MHIGESEDTIDGTAPAICLLAIPLITLMPIYVRISIGLDNEFIKLKII